MAKHRYDYAVPRPEQFFGTDTRHTKRGESQQKDFYDGSIAKLLHNMSQMNSRQLE